MANKVSQQLMFHADCNPQQQELPGCSHNNVLTEPQPLSAAVTTAVSCQASPRPHLLQQQPLWSAVHCHTVILSASHKGGNIQWSYEKIYLAKQIRVFFCIFWISHSRQSALLSVCERMFAGSCQQSSHGTVITCNMLLSASVSFCQRCWPSLS